MVFVAESERYLGKEDRKEGRGKDGNTRDGKQYGQKGRERKEWNGME